MFMLHVERDNTENIATKKVKKLQNNAFHVKTSQSGKSQLDPTKSENRPKKAIYPFVQGVLKTKTPKTP